MIGSSSRRRRRGPAGRIAAAAALVAFAFTSAPALGAGLPATRTVPGLQTAADDGYVKKVPPISTPWTAQVGPDNALPEYPRPQLTRPAWQNLNGVWQFAAATAYDQAPFGQDLAERVLVPYPIESALSGIMRHEDRMWYRRTVTVPAGWNVGATGQRLLLHFDAIDYVSTVWVNGTRVATHVGGYDGFSADVTNALVAGPSQEIVVGAADTADAPGATQAVHQAVSNGDTFGAVEQLSSTRYQPVGKQRFLRGGIWYTPTSGIWRTVWMEPVAPAHVDTLVTTPDVPGSALTVTVNTGDGSGTQLVQATALTGGTVVGTVTGRAGMPLRLPVPGARLWSPKDPFLYDLQVRLLDGATTVDEVGSYFGMRSISLGHDAAGHTRTFLNGAPITQIGPLDQGFWPDGIYTAPTDAGLRFDIEQTKQLGFNMIRKHIKVEPDRWYYWADKLGMLVWQDMPAMQAGYADTNYPPVTAQEEFKRQLQILVQSHQSWTSIVAWVPFNEGWGEWDKTATGQIADSVKAWDPSRLVNAQSGVNCCWSKGDSGHGDIFDNHTYPGPGNPTLFFDRASVAGEYGGYGLITAGHQWSSVSQGYVMTADKDSLTGCVVGAQRKLGRAIAKGISGGVYTQTTDVEDEINGFLTYDRKVMKVDAARVYAINRAILDGGDLDSAGASTGAGTPGAATPTGVWDFDEGTGTTAKDTSGQGHDGALQTGAAYTPGHRGTGIAFNGSTGYVDMRNTVINTARDFTVSAWVRMTAPGGNFETFVSEDGPNDSAFFLQYAGQDQRFAFSTTAGRALAPTSPVAGQWYHLVGVRTDGALRLYVDGDPAGQVDTCIPGQASGSFVVGRGESGGKGVDWVNGTVDGVRVFDRALTAAEVSSLFEATK